MPYVANEGKRIAPVTSISGMAGFEMEDNLS